MSKKKKKKKKVDPTAVKDQIARSKAKSDLYTMLRNLIYPPTPIKRTPLTPAQVEKERAFFRDYAKERRLAHHKHMQTMQQLIDLKLEAIRALPEDLRREALVVDQSCPPHTRHFYMDTPIMPGYDHEPSDDEDREQF